MRNTCPAPQPAKAACRFLRRDRSRRLRIRMQSLGMRRISLWIPDTSCAAIRAEARRESQLLAAMPEEARTMDFLESLVDAGDWEE
ncbi:antitoxin MazE-like protein [Solidesulfovibrio sp.]